eukprot:RCo050841
MDVSSTLCGSEGPLQDEKSGTTSSSICEHDHLQAEMERFLSTVERNTSCSPIDIRTLQLLVRLQGKLLHSLTQQSRLLSLSKDQSKMCRAAVVLQALRITGFICEIDWKTIRSALTLVPLVFPRESFLLKLYDCHHIEVFGVPRIARFKVDWGLENLPCDEGHSVPVVIVGASQAGKSLLAGSLVNSLAQPRLWRHLTCAFETVYPHRSDGEWRTWLMNRLLVERLSGVTNVCSQWPLLCGRWSITLIDTPALPSQQLRRFRVRYLYCLPRPVVVFLVAADSEKVQLRYIKAIPGSQVIVAVTRMDLIKWDSAKFRFLEEKIRKAFSDVGQSSSLVAVIPLCALSSEGVLTPASQMSGNQLSLVDAISTACTRRPTRAQRSRTVFLLDRIKRCSRSECIACGWLDGTVKLGDQLGIGRSTFLVKGIQRWGISTPSICSGETGLLLFGDTSARLPGPNNQPNFGRRILGHVAVLASPPVPLVSDIAVAMRFFCDFVPSKPLPVSGSGVRIMFRGASVDCQVVESSPVEAVSIETAKSSQDLLLHLRMFHPICALSQAQDGPEQAPSQLCHVWCETAHHFGMGYIRSVSRQLSTDVKEKIEKRKAEKKEREDKPSENLDPARKVKSPRNALSHALSGADISRIIVIGSGGKASSGGREEDLRQAQDALKVLQQLQAKVQDWAGHLLRGTRHCYMCRTSRIPSSLISEREVLICGSCTSINEMHRNEPADFSLLPGAVILTGARIKIGYTVSTRLLRGGVKLLVLTSRFPLLLAQKLEQEFGLPQLEGRVHIYGCDFRAVPTVHRLASHFVKWYSKVGVSALINNAAQSIRRPAGFYRRLVEQELQLATERACQGPSFTQLVRAVGADPFSCCADYEDCAGNSMAQLGVVSEGAKAHVGTLLGHSCASALLTQVPALEEDLMSSEFFPALPEVNEDSGEAVGDPRPGSSWVSSLLPGPTPESSPAVHPWEFFEALFVNTAAPFLLLSQLAPALCSGGSVVNVTSSAEGSFRAATAEHPHLNMAKVALNMLTA